MHSINLNCALTIAAIFFTNAHAAKNLRETNKKLITRDMLQTRIVGGNQAQRGAYPYYTQWIGGCGASLIHEDIILSAAHCDQIFETSVIVGAYKYEIVGNGALARTIVKRAVHPKYSSYTRANDYLVLKLNSPVTTIKPVILNRINAVPVSGKDLVVIGLGDLAENGPLPQFLNEVTVQAVNQTTCNQEYNGQILEASMMCAAVKGGGKDSCQGDSGGPLVQIINGEHIQVGIVSWGEGCARPSKSGVYSRVSGEIVWIEQQICALSANPPLRCTSLKPSTPTLADSNARPPTAKPSTTKLTVKPLTSKPTVMPVTSKPTAKPTLKFTLKPTKKAPKKAYNVPN